MSESRSSVFTIVLGLLAVMLVAAAPAAVLLMRSRGPAVTSITPPRARPGDAVTLAGSRFGETPQANVVLFGDQTGRILGAKANEVRVEVPELAVAEGGEVRLAVRVVAGDHVSAATDLTVYRERSTAAAEEVPAPPAGVAAATPAAVVAAGTPAPGLPAAQTPAPRAAALPPARPSAGTPSALRTPPPAATEPRATVEAARPTPEPETGAARRSFVFDRTAAESNKRAAGGLAGFDTSTVDLKRAPDVAGRIDFEVTPPHVKTGDRYTVKAYLINDGAKPIRIKEMFVATTLNGALSAGPVSPRLRDVAPRQREIIGVFSDAWKDAVAAWAMDITITSDRGDVYKNQVAWK